MICTADVPWCRWFGNKYWQDCLVNILFALLSVLIRKYKPYLRCIPDCYLIKESFFFFFGNQIQLLCNYMIYLLLLLLYVTVVSLLGLIDRTAAENYWLIVLLYDCNMLQFFLSIRMTEVVYTHSRDLDMKSEDKQ